MNYYIYCTWPLDAVVKPSDQRTMSLSTCYALVAAEEAVEDSGLSSDTTWDKHRAGWIRTVNFCPLINPISRRQERAKFHTEEMKMI